MTKAGSRPKETAYGTTDSAVAFSRRLYDQAEATAIRCRTPASQPDSRDSGTTATAATAVAVRSVAGARAPATTGLSVRATRTSRSRSR